jgi:hypothetical protein
MDMGTGYWQQQKSKRRVLIYIIYIYIYRYGTQLGLVFISTSLRASTEKIVFAALSTNSSPKFTKNKRKKKEEEERLSEQTLYTFYSSV